MRLDVGEVRDPESVRCRGDELAINEVVGSLMVLIGDCRDFELPTATVLNASSGAPLMVLSNAICSTANAIKNSLIGTSATTSSKIACTVIVPKHGPWGKAWVIFA